MRLRVRAGGEDHLTAWAPAPDGDLDAVLDEVDHRMGADAAFDARLADGTRRLLRMGAVDWVDVETRTAR